MAHRPPSRQGSLFGLGAILALVLLDYGLVALILTSAIDLLTVVRAILVILTLPGMAILFYGVSSLRSASYRVDRNAITIRWGRAQQVIPIDDVENVLHGRELGRVTRFRGLRWPGCWVGRGWVEEVGPVQFFGTSALDRHLIITTPVSSYAISPQAPDKFVDLLATQSAMGVVEPREHRLTQPQWGRPDRVGAVLLVLGGVLNLCLYIVVGVRYSGLSHSIPLHFDLTGIPDRVGPPSQLFAIAGLGSAVWMLDGALGAVLYRRMGAAMVAYLLWGAAAVVQVLVWIGLAELMGT